MEGATDFHNQPPLRGQLDLAGGDPVLAAHGPSDERLRRYGRHMGSEEMRHAGRDAERHLPEAKLIDRGGRRIDEVAYHPAYHRLMEAGLAAGYAAGPWEEGGSHAVHAALVYLTSQVEPGVCCPMTMTYAAYPALSATPALADIWQPRILSRHYDPSMRPVTDKHGVTLGMAMTERQGGSDVRANATRAVRTDTGWSLTGHKWFCSAPMSDAFLTLAQTGEGLTCFLVPRWLDGDRNAIRIDRLKDKLGNRSNASAEIRYMGAEAQMLGEEGRGIATIIEMVHHTRLDTAMAPAGLMRAALGEAHYWVERRTAFQARLIDQPLMRAVLADMVLDWEGAVALAFRVARAFDVPGERDFARLAVALAKFLNNKLCPGLVAEAMEVMGGMGYVEDTPLPMLYREAPLNGIWEGAGNVICLDILRTFAKVPAASEALRRELARAKGAHPAYDAALAEWEAEDPADPALARRFAERAARLLTAAVLFQRAPAQVAEAYAATRLNGEPAVYGTKKGLPTEALLKRLGPAD